MRRLFWVLAIAVSVGAAGCQLVVKFDRSRIPDAGPDMPADGTSD
jgi:hypothetical protein